jgi:hypothetical protein
LENKRKLHETAENCIIKSYIICALQMTVFVTDETRRMKSTKYFILEKLRKTGADEKILKTSAQTLE